MRFLCIIFLLLSGMMQAADVSLTWDASLTPGCSYVVHYGKCKEGFPPDYCYQKNAGKNLKTTIHGLKDNTLYYFAITARMAGREGPFSNEIAVNTAVQAPLAPLRLKGELLPTCDQNNTCRGSR